MPASLTEIWLGKTLGAIRALSLAHEADLLLARDSGDHISLFNDSGVLQGQRKIPEVTTAEITADGSSIVAANGSGNVMWLGIDLKSRWELQLGVRLLAAAVDSFAQYLVVSDSKGMLHFLDSSGKSLGQFHCPRPIHHLMFVPAVPFLACAADFGWAGFLDLLRGDWAWTDRPVTNISGLAVAGAGEPFLLACFTEGLRAYGSNGSSRAIITLPKPCDAVAVSFDGQHIIAAGKSREIFACRHKSEEIESLSTPHTPLALGVSAKADRIYCGYGDGGVQCFERK